MSELTTNNQQLTTKRGPKTPEGKKRSSLNALKHGLTAKSPQAIDALDKDSTVKFRTCLTRVLEWAQPRGAVEERLARQLARNLWTLARIRDRHRQIQAHILLSTHPKRAAREVAQYKRHLCRRINEDSRFFEQKRKWENRSCADSRQKR
ncbi:MAG: hypothetical protein Q7T82_20010 [Armatimonadota bacterium]|nr:hypothetical protein [Armatimonadota bacterium]